jgi:anti-anti-sigma factor
MTMVHRIHPLPPMQGMFHLDVWHGDPGEAVIYVCGELDIATTPVLDTCLSNLLDIDTGCRALVVDLSAAPFVDVSAANILVDAHRRATDRGVTLSLTGCSAQLVRLLHVIHVLDVINIMPTQRTCSTARGDNPGSSAQTDLPSGNGVTPHRNDTAATTCNPRPRRLLGSIGRGRSGGHG